MTSQRTPAERAALELELLARAASRRNEQASQASGPLPLSFAQEGLWFFEQLAPEIPLYNLPWVQKLCGSLNRDALESSLRCIVQRQEALRTRIVSLDGSPRQETVPNTFQLDFVDLSGSDSLLAGEQAAQLISEEIKRPFRLAQELPFRARLFRLEERVHYLAVTLHHIVSDFASLKVFNQELETAYRAFALGAIPSFPPLRLSFAQWAARSRESASETALSRAWSFWQQRLSPPLPLVHWPADEPPLITRNFRGQTERFTLGKELSLKLNDLAREENATLYMVLLSAFQVVLSRYTGQRDFLVASPMNQRGAPGTEELIGLFLNTLALRGDLSGRPSFRQLLERTRLRAIEAFAHQEMPFEKLTEKLSFQNEPGRNPLTEAVFQYLSEDWPALSLNGLEIESLPASTGTAKFPLTLTFYESGTGLKGELEYSSDRVGERTASSLVESLRVLLESVVNDPGVDIGRLPLLSNGQRDAALVLSNRTSTDYPRDSSIPELFEKQVRKDPDACAIVAGGEQLTYNDLNKRANQLAHFLLRAKVQPGDRVGLALGRSVEMIIGLLAILKMGAAYVPIDPQLPMSRLSHLARDSGSSLILSTRDQVERLSQLGRQVVPVDQAGREGNELPSHDLGRKSSALDLACLMYTSGSTGEPKGVAVSHRGIIRLVRGTNYARFSSDEVFLQFAPLSFDASTFEIWGALLNGAKLAIFPPIFESLEQLAQIIRKHQVTTLWLTAGLFQQMIDEQLGAFAMVRQVLAGGDVLSVPHVLKFLRTFPGCALTNGYGPTENTTFTCCYRFPQDWAGGSSAPIGCPISNTRVYILDEYLAPVPPGVPGELCAGGDGVALGYWNSPALTAERFLPDPFSCETGARLYRTGDNVRQRSDGTIEFLGRSDDQVKINGFRIHLSEVETALAELPGIRQIAVVSDPGPNGLKELVACIVPEAAEAFSAIEFRRLAAERLPGYMVPHRFVPLAALPLSANGKIDRRSLTQAVQPAASASPPPAPADPIQERLLGIWKDILGHERIGIRDSFFDLGGHSLLATRMLSRINQAFQLNLSLAALFEEPTIERLAIRVAQAPRHNSPPIQRRGRPLSDG